jgi:hypothetical protein
VTLLGETKPEAPAQTELRPTCAGVSRVALACGRDPNKFFRVKYDTRSRSYTDSRHSRNTGDLNYSVANNIYQQVEVIPVRELGEAFR